jgi:hypothetical protein
VQRGRGAASDCRELQAALLDTGLIMEPLRLGTKQRDQVQIDKSQRGVKESVQVDTDGSILSHFLGIHGGARYGSHAVVNLRGAE